MPSPLVQIALDTTSIDSARRLGTAAVAAGVDWIEFGKPLIEYEGLNGVRPFAAEFPEHYLLLDVMIIAAADRYVGTAKEIGAQNVTVSALAPEATVDEAIRSGAKHGIAVTVDLFNVADPVATARRFAHADYVMVHFGVDQKRHSPAGSPIALLREVVQAVDTPVSYATYDVAESRAAVEAGAAVIVQGEPLLSVDDPERALTEFIAATKSAPSSPAKGNK